jgi:hypothetical protein
MRSCGFLTPSSHFLGFDLVVTTHETSTAYPSSNPHVTSVAVRQYGWNITNPSQHALVGTVDRHGCPPGYAQRDWDGAVARMYLEVVSAHMERRTSGEDHEYAEEGRNNNAR